LKRNEKEEIMKTVIIGCGRMGVELATRLFRAGHEVAIVDPDENNFNLLPADFHGKLVEGDSLNQDVLKRSGIASCDAIAVVTHEDEVNLVVSHVAREHFKVPKVLVRCYDPHYMELYKVFNFQVVSGTSWAAQRLEEMVYHSEVRTVLSAGNGEVEIYELKVPVQWEGKKVVDLVSSQGCMAVSLTRGGAAVLPSPEMVLQENDFLLISATSEGIENLRQLGCFQPEVK
jgi:trk system potassium uptake protein TrkA